MARIFISYVHEDLVVAEALQRLLKSELPLRDEVFLAADQTHIVAGDVWLDKIKKALRSCEILILMLSGRSFGWLRQIAMQELKDPVKFWNKVAANPVASAPPSSLIRLLALPKGCTDLRLLRRQAGVGSLGRPRFVALAMHQGGLIAREAKAVIPPAGAWALETRRPKKYSIELSRRAVRASDPFFNADGRWTVRRLSPDCLKIEVGNLPGHRDDAKLLRAMGWETANLHLGTPHLRVKEDIAARGRRWLDRATTDMVDALVDEHRAWKKHQRDLHRADSSTA